MPSFKFTGGDIEIKAAQGEDAPAISITAYNGGLLRLGNFQHPIVIDLNGVKAANNVPFLIDHVNATNMVIGQGSVRREGETLLATGKLTGTSAAAQEIISTAKNGHVYQASIGAIPMKSTMIEEGVKAKINGKEFTGPLVHVTASEIIEVSVVAIGADRDGTEVDIAAMFGLPENSSPEVGKIEARKEPKMNPKFLAWVQAHLGLDEAGVKALDADKLAKIEATFASTKIEEKVAPVKAAADPMIAELAEKLRVTEIKAACGNDYADLMSKAIAEKWETTTVEASISEIVKARDSRPSAPGVIVRGDKADAKVIEAAVALGNTSMSQKSLEASYGEETLDRADKMRHMSLKEVMAASCATDGIAVPSIGSTNDEWAQAAFRTRTFPTVLSNVANKMLWEGYNARESIATMVSKKLNANDFKTHTNTRVNAGGGMELVENGGEIKHQTIEDEKYTYSIQTYGELLGLTRQDIINDDLGAFSVIPAQMGWDAWQKREEAFWTLVLANTGSFYHADNGNLLTGSGSALSITALNAAIALFEKQTDAKGRAIAISPEYMLVPSDLSATADGFYSSDLIITGEDATVNNKNVHKSKYRPLATPFLSNTGITGYSTTAWYLFADPRSIASYGIAYLNGREGPVIEETQPDVRYLGRVFRAYMDFGVCQIDPNGSVKNAGA